MYRTVKYELLSLEAWLATRKRPNHALLSKIIAETARIRAALLLGAITLTDELHVQRYIRTHHYGIIQLLNAGWNKSQTQKEVTNALVQLQTNIEEEFHCLLDPQSDLSYLHRQQVINQCNKTIEQLHKAFAMATITEALQAAVTCCLREVQLGQGITYHQQKFIQTYISEIHQQLTSPDQLNEDGWSKFLITAECNTDTIFDYWRNRITKQLNKVELPTEKRKYLTDLHREIQFLQAKHSLRFHPHAMSLRNQLLIFIEGELAYIEKSLQHRGTAIVNDAPEENFRLRTEFSVSQLACFVKALVDTRIIVNPNVSELLRFLAHTTVTKRAEVISFDSLRAKYYNIESGTREAIRQTLQNLTKNISSL